MEQLLWVLATKSLLFLPCVTPGQWGHCAGCSLQTAWVALCCVSVPRSSHPGYMTVLYCTVLYCTVVSPCPGHHTRDIWLPCLESCSCLPEELINWQKDLYLITGLYRTVHSICVVSVSITEARVCIYEPICFLSPSNALQIIAYDYSLSVSPTSTHVTHSFIHSSCTLSSLYKGRRQCPGCPRCPVFPWASLVSRSSRACAV